MHTKIVCTIGPSCNTLEAIYALVDAGMHVARLNFSHGTHKEHAQVIEWIKEVRQKRNIPLAIMLDTKGPEIRVGMLAFKELHFDKGDRFFLIPEGNAPLANEIPIIPSKACHALQPGMTVLFDNGYIAAQVIESDGSRVVIEMRHSGTLLSHKRVSLPGVKVDLPALTTQDCQDLIFGAMHQVDFIAASFIRSKEDLLAIKHFLAAHQGEEIQLLAKIENEEGVENFDQILAIADGIMIARGDLGVEMPLEQVPHLQKMMIDKCYLAGKPAFTATQMLETMIFNPRPTRAEVSDVANAIYDSTSCVVLAGETAVGKFPFETVKMMQAIIQEAEKDFDFKNFLTKRSAFQTQDTTAAIAHATVHTAYQIKARAIFIFTESGFTAELISSFRPKMTVIAVTPNERCYHQLAASWGVIPLFAPTASTLETTLTAASNFALLIGVVQPGDLVVVTAGSPFGIQGSTNALFVHQIEG